MLHQQWSANRRMARSMCKDMQGDWRSRLGKFLLTGSVCERFNCLLTLFQNVPKLPPPPLPLWKHLVIKFLDSFLNVDLEIWNYMPKFQYVCRLYPWFTVELIPASYFICACLYFPGEENIYVNLIR